MFDFRDNKLFWKPLKELPDLSSAKLIGIDTETKDQNIRKLGPGGYRNNDGHICGICIATNDNYSGYIPLRHPNSNNFDFDKVKLWFNDQMTKKNQPKVGANILYDLEWLDAEGFKIEGPFYDVQVAEPLLDEYRGKYNLQSLTEQYLEQQWHKLGNSMKIKAEQFLGKEIKDDIRQYIYLLPANIVGPYGEMDALSSVKVFLKQLDFIKEQQLEEVFDLETRLLPVVLAMRKRGVKINVNKIDYIEASMCSKLSAVYKEIKHITGIDLDSLKSADQLKPAYDALGVNYPLTKKTQKPSITTPWLEHQVDELSPLILEGRRYMTAIDTFLNGTIKNHLVGDRIHCQFHTLKNDEYGTVSGRFSCSKPNPQQIPGREDAFVDLIRGLFIPDNDEQWWKIDWSQIEYRLIVHYACLMKFPGANEVVQRYIQDPKTDFHQVVADLCGIERKPAKNVNFGVAYGMGINSLKNKLGMNDAEAKKFMKEYHKNAPFMKKLTDDTSKAAKKRGYIRTVMGRRARFHLWEPPNNYKTSPKYVDPLPYDQAVETWGTCINRAKTYTAMNRLIQGSAADLMKKAMVDSYESGIYDVLGIPSLTIHDELDGSKPITKEADEALRELVHCMNTCIEFKVPIMAEAQIGENWWKLENFK